MYKLVVRIVSSACVNWCVHELGDFFEVEDDMIWIPPGKRICVWSLSALLPFLSACQRENSESSNSLPTVEYIHCPDPKGKVVWKIERVSL